MESVRAIARTFGWLLFATCIRSSSVQCADGSVCPVGTECASFKDLVLCVDPDQRAACEGLVDGTQCEAGFLGTCHDGVCFPIGCGNGRIDDPLYLTAEQCDDGGRASHDGCSSTCQLETPRVRGLSLLDIQFFSALADHSMALDTSRGTVTMFGGASYGGPNSASPLTVERARDAWSLRRAEPAPVARFGAAVAYDARRARLLLFGGQSDGPLLGDTWEWNGERWIQVATQQQPPPRQGHAIAYDPIRGTMVLFGGSAGPQALGDTWEWNGSEWTHPALADSPPPMSGHSMVFDPARGVIVLVGDNASEVETWEYDGAWQRIPTTSSPQFGVGAALGYDGVDRTIVHVGGAGATVGSGTWQFDGTDWRQTISQTPDGLTELAVAMEPSGGRVIVNGGFDTMGNATARTWRWDGAAWSALADQNAFQSPGCTEPLISLDSHRRRLVAFCNTTTGETWWLDDTGWHRGPVGLDAPPPRLGGMIAYDSARRETVLFGGEPLPSDPTDDRTWTWDGVSATWTAHATAEPAPLLREAAIAFDGEQIVLFGGQRAGSLVDEIWRWNGTGWTRVLAPGPGFRKGAAMSYDPIRDRVILFGGNSGGVDPLGDTWEWDRTGWRLFPAPDIPTLRPSVRSNHGLAWDAARRRLVLVGGRGRNNSAADIWEWDGTQWFEVPSFALADRAAAIENPEGAGIVLIDRGVGAFLMVFKWRADTEYEACGPGDHDRDGLRGCDDPDCWARCTPACPPGASCGSDEPRCGDTNCDPLLENCHLCPGDCGVCPVVCGDFVCSPNEDCVGDCV